MAVKITPAEALTESPASPSEKIRRVLMGSLLFDGDFKVFSKANPRGESAFDALNKVSQLVDPAELLSLAVEAREKLGLRTTPQILLLLALMHQHRQTVPSAVVIDSIVKVCRRADDMGRLIEAYWKGGKKPLPAVMKKGLAESFKRFNAYQLAKYDRPPIRPRDVMFLTHPKPDNEEQVQLFRQVAEKSLPTPDTWETSLSGGADKRETFTRLLNDKALGGLAILRNLRNMTQAGVNKSLIEDRLINASMFGVLPFQFLSAFREAPEYCEALQSAMVKAVSRMPKLPGRTVLLIDISGSMAVKMGGNSTLTRLDAAKALAILVREMSEQLAIAVFNTTTTPKDSSKRGFALLKEIGGTLGGTDIGQAVRTANKNTPDRTIVVTDEDSNVGGMVPAPVGRGYMMNVSNNQKGVGYSSGWNHVHGFSENLLRYIAEHESIF